MLMFFRQVRRIRTCLLLFSIRSTTIPSPSLHKLRPDTILSAGEKYLQKRLDGVITPYNSYVNRVYGVKDEDEIPYILKFYSPKRWSAEAIREEHRFISQCAEDEIPVVAPLETTAGVSGAGAGTMLQAEGLLYTVFPLRGGRTFDIACDEDWVRLGSIVGRMHRVGRREEASHRTFCSPGETTAAQAEKLLESGLIPPDLRPEFVRLCTETIETIEPLLMVGKFRLKIGKKLPFRIRTA